MLTAPPPPLKRGGDGVAIVVVLVFALGGGLLLGEVFLGARRSRRAARERLRDERGAAIIETVLVLPILIGILMATMAFGMGAIAKAIVTNAARDSARLAAIECGQGNSNWFSDAEGAAQAALAHGLYVGTLAGAPQTYGAWDFQASCSAPGQPGGAVTVVLTYEEINLFPPIASLLAPGSGPGSKVFNLQAAAVFPEE